LINGRETWQAEKRKPGVSAGFIRGLFDEHPDQLAPEKD
jgi:hypothetical protein